MRNLQRMVKLVSIDGEEVRFKGVRGKKRRQGRVSCE